MNQFFKITMICGLVAVMLFSVQEQAEAQRRGGRSRSGNYQRTNARGQSPNGTWQGHRNWERGKGYRKSQAGQQAETPRGTFSRQRNSSTERTGDNTYNRRWDTTKTGPNGNSRTWKGEGSGTVERTDNGYTNSYQGTATSPRGQEYGVDKTTTRSKTDDGWQKSTDRTVTDSNGNVIGTGSSTSTGAKGEGVTTDGSWTHQKSGRTTDYNGSTYRTDDGLQRDQSISSPNNTYSRSRRWRYVDGQWVRYSENTRGGSSTLQVDSNETDD